MARSSRNWPIYHYNGKFYYTYCDSTKGYLKRYTSGTLDAGLVTWDMQVDAGFPAFTSTGARIIWTVLQWDQYLIFYAASAGSTVITDVYEAIFDCSTETWTQTATIALSSVFTFNDMYVSGGVSLDGHLVLVNHQETRIMGSGYTRPAVASKTSVVGSLTQRGAPTSPADDGNTLNYFARGGCIGADVTFFAAGNWNNVNYMRYSGYDFGDSTLYYYQTRNLIAVGYQRWMTHPFQAPLYSPQRDRYYRPRVDGAGTISIVEFPDDLTAAETAVEFFPIPDHGTASPSLAINSAGDMLCGYYDKDAAVGSDYTLRLFLCLATDAHTVWAEVTGANAFTSKFAYPLILYSDGTDFFAAQMGTDYQDLIEAIAISLNASVEIELVGSQTLPALTSSGSLKSDFGMVGAQTLPALSSAGSMIKQSPIYGLGSMGFSYSVTGTEVSLSAFSYIVKVAGVEIPVKSIAILKGIVPTNQLQKALNIVVDRFVVDSMSVTLQGAIEVIERFDGNDTTIYSGQILSVTPNKAIYLINSYSNSPAPSGANVIADDMSYLSLNEGRVRVRARVNFGVNPRDTINADGIVFRATSVAYYLSSRTRLMEVA